MVLGGAKKRQVQAQDFVVYEEYKQPFSLIGGGADAGGPTSTYVPLSEPIWQTAARVYLKEPQMTRKIDWNQVLFVDTYEDRQQSCPICLEKEFKSPRITACGHLYCWVCLIRYVWSRGQKDVVCPLCSDYVDLQDLRAARVQLNLKGGVEHTFVLTRRQKTSNQLEIPILGTTRNQHVLQRVQTLTPLDTPQDVPGKVLNKEGYEFVVNASEFLTPQFFHLFALQISDQPEERRAVDFALDQLHREAADLGYDITQYLATFETLCDTATDDLVTSIVRNCPAEVTLTGWQNRVCTDAKEIGEQLKINTPSSVARESGEELNKHDGGREGDGLPRLDRQGLQYLKDIPLSSVYDHIEHEVVPTDSADNGGSLDDMPKEERTDEELIDDRHKTSTSSFAGLYADSTPRKVELKGSLPSMSQMAAYACYQHYSGEMVFLSGAVTKHLFQACGGVADRLPAALSRVKQCWPQDVIVGPSTKSRFPFLSHLPQGLTVTVMEADLSEYLVALARRHLEDPSLRASVLESHKSHLGQLRQQRVRDRQRRARNDRLYEEYVKANQPWAQQQWDLRSTTDLSQFPASLDNSDFPSLPTSDVPASPAPRGTTDPAEPVATGSAAVGGSVTPDDQRRLGWNHHRRVLKGSEEDFPFLPFSNK